MLFRVISILSLLLVFACSSEKTLTKIFEDDYDQFEISAEMMGDKALYLQDNMPVTVNFIEGKPVSVNLPPHVTLTITETEPALKNQTVTSSYKPAVLENGIRTTVPPFVNAGEKIVVSTEDNSYVERAK